MTLNSQNKGFSAIFGCVAHFIKWIAPTRLEIDLDNLQTATAKAVASLTSFA